MDEVCELAVDVDGHTGLGIEGASAGSCAGGSIGLLHVSVSPTTMAWDDPDDTFQLCITCPRKEAPAAVDCKPCMFILSNACTS
jgi:hypothetical protein